MCPPETGVDHFPILFEGGGLRRGPSIFKFENMWLKVEGFKDLLKGGIQEEFGFGSTAVLGC
ncbi:hypothetical protein AAG906_015249 [Vitis piasezkii]